MEIHLCIESSLTMFEILCRCGGCVLFCMTVDIYIYIYIYIFNGFRQCRRPKEICVNCTCTYVYMCIHIDICRYVHMYTYTLIYMCGWTYYVCVYILHVELHMTLCHVTSCFVVCVYIYMCVYSRHVTSRHVVCIYIYIYIG